MGYPLSCAGTLHCNPFPAGVDGVACPPQKEVINAGHAIRILLPGSTMANAPLVLLTSGALLLRAFPVASRETPAARAPLQTLSLPRILSHLRARSGHVPMSHFLLATQPRSCIIVIDGLNSLTHRCTRFSVSILSRFPVTCCLQTTAAESLLI